jgi:hypothetical protein
MIQLRPIYHRVRHEGEACWGIVCYDKYIYEMKWHVEEKWIHILRIDLWLVVISFKWKTTRKLTPSTKSIKQNN